MAVPKHSNPTQPRKTEGAVPKARPPQKQKYDIWARAPYNFIPLPERVLVVDKDSLPERDSFTNGYTGAIICTLKTLSPLYVRGMMKPKDFEDHGEKRFDQLPDDEQRRLRAKFYSVDGVSPRIPGSTLRGMIRSVVEIISFSKVEWVTDEPLVYRAVADDAESPLGKTYRDQLRRDEMRAGYIVKDNHEWKVRPALPIDGQVFATTRQSCPPGKDWHNIANAKEIRVGTGTWVGAGNTREWRIDDLRGVGGKGESALFVSVDRAPNAREGEKNQYLFGLPDNTATLVEIPDDVVRRYKEQVSQQQARFLKHREGALRDKQPVFYLTDKEGKVSFFGHCRYFRLPYEKSPHGLVPDQLRRDTDIDLADAVFGYVGKPIKNHETRAGRVAVGDATLQPHQNNVWMPFTAQRGKEWFTPSVLASPKPTTFQHYLVQDKDQGHDPDCKQWLAHYGTPVEQTVIRGSKRYWHKHTPPDANRLAWRRPPGASGDSASQLTGIQPVNKDVGFTFTVRFESLSAVELGALLWALELPSGCAHSVGMGKPLGMGSVEVKVKQLHLSDRKARYTTLLDGNDWAQPPLIDSADFKHEFEKFVLSALKVEGGTFTQLVRIQALLDMLRYPGPDDEWTRYMQIAREDGDYRLNEYKDRPVLPDTAHVIANEQCVDHRKTERCRELPRQPRNSAQQQGDRRDTPVSTGREHERASSQPQPAIEPVQTSTGEIIEIRPDRRTGKVRDRSDGKVYSFTTDVIRGNFPANRSQVEFDVRDGRVTRVRRL